MAQPKVYDLERGELTPLLRSGNQPNHDAGPLEDMKSASLKEKAVTGIAGAGCEHIGYFFCFGQGSYILHAHYVTTFITYFNSPYFTFVDFFGSFGKPAKRTHFQRIRSRPRAVCCIPAAQDHRD